MMAVQELYEKIKSLEIFYDGKRKRIPLVLEAADFTELLGQYWSSAQSRILRLSEKLLRGNDVVPRSLLPNDKLMDLMLSKWHDPNAGYVTDSGSDSE